MPVHSIAYAQHHQSGDISALAAQKKDDNRENHTNIYIRTLLDRYQDDPYLCELIETHQSVPPRSRQGKPSYKTPEYWRYMGSLVDAGILSEAQREEETRIDFVHYLIRRERAIASQDTITPQPKRRFLPAPRQSKQYAGAMSTESARDGRLTPQAKALLQLLRALCGHGGTCETTKNRLAGTLSRCTRSIQRYIRELTQYDYIRVAITRRRNGLYSGLRIHLSPHTLPFFKNDGLLAEWLVNGGNTDKTKLSSLLTTIKKSGLFSDLFAQIEHPLWE